MNRFLYFIFSAFPSYLAYQASVQQQQQSQNNSSQPGKEYMFQNKKSKNNGADLEIQKESQARMIGTDRLSAVMAG